MACSPCWSSCSRSGRRSVSRARSRPPKRSSGSSRSFSSRRDAMSDGETEMLLAPTPDAWVQAAAGHWRELLNEHAQCGKKASPTAPARMFTYPEDRRLASTLSRLAREELRHFEQVQKLMITLQVPFERQRPG